MEEKEHEPQGYAWLRQNEAVNMIEWLFRLAFAVMCGIGAVAAALWVLVLMPAWLRERKLAKQAAATREQKHRARIGRRRATAEAAAEGREGAGDHINNSKEMGEL